jgi:hypothetical protein
MPRRNRSHHVHAPNGGQPGTGYAEEFAGQYEPEAGRQGGRWDDEGRWEADETGHVRRIVSERPHTSVLTAFGLGFGLGLVVTMLLSREEESWFERYAPEAIQDLPDRLKHAKLRIASAVPSSLQQAGESLASYVPSSWKRW